MSVTTLYATALSSSSITLTGTLDDLHGEASLDVSFEWGATSAYGNETTPAAVAATGSITADISTSGLDQFHTAGATYHFRAKATDGITTWYGYDREFAVLLYKGSDPYVIDNDMTSGTLTDVRTFRAMLMLDYYHGMKENPEFKGASITGGLITPIIAEKPEFKGASITSGLITPIIAENPEFKGASITGGLIT
jgi:hypothetical protein